MNNHGSQKNVFKILHMNWKIWPDYKGGHVIQAQDLINELRVRNHQQGYLFTGYRDDNSKISLKHFKQDVNLDCWALLSPDDIYKLPRADMASPAVENSVIRVVKNFNPQLIHIHHMIGFTASTIERLKAELNIPIIINLRDYYYICPKIDLLDSKSAICTDDAHGERCTLCYQSLSINHSPGQKAHIWAGEFKARKFAWIRSLNHANKITTVSSYLRDFYIQNGIPPDRIVALPTGTAMQKYEKRINVKQKDEKFRVAFLGDVSLAKGIGLLLDGLAIWKDPDVLFEIWGAIRPEVRERLKSINDPRIVFKGVYDRKEIPEILANVDLGIVPSISADTAPQVIFEFLSQGIPVVASNIGGIPDFVKNGFNGLLFGPNNVAALLERLNFLKNNPTYYEKLKSNIMPHKTTTDYAIEIESLYEEMLTRKDRAGISRGILVELGGGETPSRKMEGFVNIDLRPTPKVNIVADARYVPLSNGKVSEIYAANLVEHFPRKEIGEVFIEWWRLLDQGGWIDMMLPDLEGTLDNWRKMPFHRVLDSLYGAQKFPGDFHFNGFTIDTLKNVLREFGFSRFPVNYHQTLYDVPRIIVRAQKRTKIRYYTAGDTTLGSSRLRIHRIYPHLIGKGYDIHLFGDPSDCDVAIFQKTFKPELVERCRGVTILDIDDNFFDYTPMKAACQKVSKMVSAIVASTQQLADIASKYSDAPVFVIPTGLDLYGNQCYGQKVPHEREEAKLAGWIGYPENLHYLDEIIPALRELGMRLRVITRAGAVNKLWLAENKDIIELCDWSLSSADGLLSQCDIGVAPLKSDSWSSSKSGVKILKYWALGIPAVCSPMPEYLRLESKLGVQIVAKNMADWKTLLQKKGNNWEKQVCLAQSELGKYTSKEISEKWHRLIEKLVYQTLKDKKYRTPEVISLSKCA